jgi:protein-L-isoaspartate O-methyltransferase
MQSSVNLASPNALVQQLESRGSLVIPSQIDPSELAGPVKVMDGARSESESNQNDDKSESER